MTTTALPPVLGPESESAAPQTGWLSVLPRLIRVWAVRSTLSIIDQGLTASVGFGVNVLLARWLPANIYGAFAVAFAGFLFVSGFHNALLLEPLTVIGPARHAKRLFTYFRQQLVVHALLVGALSIAILLAGGLLSRITPQSPLPGALLGSGVALPFLLLLWLVRRMCYVLQRPSTAVFGSIFYVAFVLGGLWLLHQFDYVNPFTAFLLTATGSFLSAALLWLRIAEQAADETRGDPISWREVLKENWTYGRWLVGSTAMNSVSTQAQMILVAGAVGLGAAGVLRAMQIPALVMQQILAATGLLVLPAFSYDFGAGSIVRMRHKANVVSVVLTVGTLSIAIILGLFAGRTEYILYGGKYASNAQLMPLLALVPVASAASTGYSLALRASQRPHFDLLASAIAAPAALISAAVFIHWWGLGGAAASLLLSYVTSAVVTCWVYRVSGPLAASGKFTANSHPEILPTRNTAVNVTSSQIAPPNYAVRASQRKLQVRCPICGSPAAHRFSLQHTSVWECREIKCNLQFANPQLDDADLTRAYERFYYPSANNGHTVQFEIRRKTSCVRSFLSFRHAWEHWQACGSWTMAAA